MKILILYASATGNTEHLSKYIKQLLEQLDSSLQIGIFSIRQLMSQRNRGLPEHLTYSDYDAFVLATYTDCSREPEYVNDFLKDHVDFNGKYVLIGGTAGIGPGS